MTQQQFQGAEEDLDRLAALEPFSPQEIVAWLGIPLDEFPAWVIRWSAPRSFRRASFSSDDEVAMTVAPAALANRTRRAKWPLGQSSIPCEGG